MVSSICKMGRSVSGIWCGDKPIVTKLRTPYIHPLDSCEHYLIHIQILGPTTHTRARAPYWTQKLNMILWMNQTTIVYRRKRMFRRRYRWYIILETTSVCATKERLIIETQGSNQSSLYSTQSLRCVNETNVCRYNVQDFESFTYNIHLKKRWEHDDAIVQFVLFSHNKVVGSNLSNVN